MAFMFWRRKSERPRKVRSTGSNLALKSRNTLENCGKTTRRKNSSTPQAADSRNAGYRKVVGQDADATPRRAGAPCLSPRESAPNSRRLAHARERNIDRGKTLGWCEIASAKLSPARIADVTFVAVDRMRPISESAASNSSASLILAPVRSKRARSPVKMVTSSGRGRENSAKSSRRLIGASLSSVTESMGISPRYSMRRPTSAAVGAAIDPLTTSPTWLRAR